MAFCAEAGFEDNWTSPMAFDSALVSDNEDNNDEDPFNLSMDMQGPNKASARGETREDYHLPNTVLQENSGLNIIQEDMPVQQQEQTDEAKLWELHHQYGHAPFAKLCEMAKQGVIPRRLAKCRVPICAACMYSKGTTRVSNSGEPSR
jgi:hypothetical protein